MSTLLAFGLIGTRVTAMLITAPVLGHRTVPVYVKLILAVVITIAAGPLILQQPTVEQHIATIQAVDFASGALTEIVIGGLLGLGMLIIFSAAQMIGSVIGQLAGLQLETANPSDQSIGQLAVERLISMVAIAMFVLARGPELLLSSVLDSFNVLPLGPSIREASAVHLITGLLSQSFELTVLAVAPAIASLLISTIAVGILMRALPQLNLIQLGLSSNMAMMMLALTLMLGGCGWLLIDSLQPTVNQILTDFETLTSPH